MLLNRYLAARLPELRWRHFGVGALQAYLFEGPGYEQRVHIWDESLVAKGIRGAGDVHDHRFSFRSDVLVGAVVDIPYYTNPMTWEEASKCDRSDVWTRYLVQHARAAKEEKGEFRCNYETDPRPFAVCSGTDRVIVDGSSYEVAHGGFHTSRFLGLTVTVVTKFDYQDFPASILVPGGRELVQAFDPDRKADINGIVAEAMVRLQA